MSLKNNSSINAESRAYPLDFSERNYVAMLVGRFGSCAYFALASDSQEIIDTVLEISNRENWLYRYGFAAQGTGGSYSDAFGCYAIVRQLLDRATGDKSTPVYNRLAEIGLDIEIYTATELKVPVDGNSSDQKQLHMIIMREFRNRMLRQRSD